MPRPDRRAAAAAAEEFRQTLQSTDIPVDPIALAHKAGIRVEPLDTSDFSGCLLRAGQRFAIFHSTAIANEGFRRFTIGHELGHHELRAHHPHLFRLGEQHVSRSNFVSDAWYEQEADSFAAELLMPEAAFLEEMRRRGLGLPAIKAFAGVFQTSLTSTAIRYAQLTPDPVAVVVSEQGLVCYCFASSCMRRIRADYLPKGSPLPHSSETFRMVRAARSEAEGTSYLSAWFSNPVRELRFDEDVIDLGSYGKVLTVLHVREVPDPESDEDEDAEEGDHFTPDGKRYRW